MAFRKFLYSMFELMVPGSVVTKVIRAGNIWVYARECTWVVSKKYCYIGHCCMAFFYINKPRALKSKGFKFNTPEETYQL